MSGPSRRHQDSLPSGKSTRGFAAALREHCRIGLGRYPFVPDAYEFDADRRELVLHEVVVTHALDERKLMKLRDLRDLLTAIGWSLRLMIGSYGRFVRADLATGQPTDDETARAVLLLDRESTP